MVVVEGGSKEEGETCHKGGEEPSLLSSRVKKSIKVKLKTMESTEKTKSVTSSSSKNEEWDDETLAMLGLDGGEEEKPKPKKPVFHFQRAGLVIPVWAVLTLEKSVEWTSKPKTHPIYGIIINRGLDPTPQCPTGEKSMWYEKEEVRDKAFDAMLKEMSSSAFKVISL